jgi:outer membrane protein
MAQNKVISLEEAIATALANNYDVLITKNGLKLDKLDYENAINTFLPNLGIGLSGTYEKSNRQLFDGTGTFKIGDRNFNNIYYGANLGLNVRINDVVDAFLNLDRSEYAVMKSEYNTKASLQNIIQQVISSYYNLAKQQQLLDVQKQAVETSKEQVRKAESRYEIGSVAKKDVLTAKVQLNNDKTNLLNQELQLQNAKNTLNISLGLGPLTSISVNTTVSLKSTYNDYQDVESEVFNNNPELLSSNQLLNESEVSKDRAYNSLLPNISFNMGYNKSFPTDTIFGNITSKFTELDRDYSFSAGLNATYNLNYGNFLQDEQAEINLQNTILKNEKTKKDIQANAYRAFTSYQNSKQILIVQEENLEATREDLRLAQERFNLGSGTSLELRQAQDGLTRAEAQLINAKFDAKLAEVELDKLTGVISVE